jgi:hypothetical protein
LNPIIPGSWVASCDIAGVASVVARIAAAPSSVSFVILILHLNMRTNGEGQMLVPETGFTAP